MKRNFISWILLAGCSVFTACGAKENSQSNITQNSATSLESFEAIESADSDVNFELTSDFKVDSSANIDSFIIPAGTGLSILDKSLVNGTEMIRIGLEYVTDTEAPQDIWVTADALLQAKLVLLNETDPYDENGNIFSVSEFLRKKMTYCYRYVKKYLLSHGMVSVYLPGSSAWMAATELPKNGFKKSSRRPSTAIVNDVCVYKGGPAGHGHIEILTSKGWYYGYGYKMNPIQNRIFIGCFHK